MMSHVKEYQCIKILKKLLEENYEETRFSILTEIDGAVCLVVKKDHYDVFEKEGNEYNNICNHDNAIEAALDMITRLSVDKKQAAIVKNMFLDKVIFEENNITLEERIQAYKSLAVDDDKLAKLEIVESLIGVLPDDMTVEEAIAERCSKI